MSKKAILALMIAVLMPLIGYFILKAASDHSIVMPRKFLLDTVVTRIENGKQMTDSIWHQTANIKLVNQLGDSVSLYDKPGKILVIDFFFTHCPGPCPILTRNMRKLQQSFANYQDGRRVIDSSVVQFISFTVDPERDSVPVLKAYADKFSVSPDNWWMLTGPKKQIYDFAFNELKMGLLDGHGVDTAFLHTQDFLVLDRNHVLRGLYDGRDTADLAKLAKDVGLLMLEKDRTKKSELFTEIIDLKWIWVIVVLLVIVFSVYFSMKRKSEY
ncbi:MAG: SCO family protein [Bacteroidota bacterium]|nr:SCO family protein [Bacteroidota bacterium]